MPACSLSRLAALPGSPPRQAEALTRGEGSPVPAGVEPRVPRSTGPRPLAGAARPPRPPFPRGARGLAGRAGTALPATMQSRCDFLAIRPAARFSCSDRRGDRSRISPVWKGQPRRSGRTLRPSPRCNTHAPGPLHRRFPYPRSGAAFAGPSASGTRAVRAAPRRGSRPLSGPSIPPSPLSPTVCRGYTRPGAALRRRLPPPARLVPAQAGRHIAPDTRTPPRRARHEGSP